MTDTILTSNYEHERFLDWVNDFFTLETGLVHVDSVEDGRWYGGSKCLQTDVAIGAFNYFDLSEFIAHLKTIPWEYPECVQLIISEEDDETFRIIGLQDSEDKILGVQDPRPGNSELVRRIKGWCRSNRLALPVYELAGYIEHWERGGAVDERVQLGMDRLDSEKTQS